MALYEDIRPVDKVEVNLWQSGSLATDRGLPLVNSLFVPLVSLLMLSINPLGALFFFVSPPFLRLTLILASIISVVWGFLCARRGLRKPPPSDKSLQIYPICIEFFFHSLPGAPMGQTVH